MHENPPAGLRFSLLAKAIRRQIDDAVREDGLTGVQLFVLCELQKQEEAGIPEIRQRDLESACHVTHPTMTEILQRLEKKGYIRCTRSELDRRSKRVVSTEQAHGLRMRMSEADRRTFAALCEGLTEEEVRTLLRLTDHMVQNALPMLRKGSDDCCD